ncbi:MAG: FAD-binding protein [Pseudomonadales bacterium]|nr:FAD-binding protein [Pseudomonadales bacterium]MCP5186045.1 FAD-binding protein [Pseudomonadales bacterium]
MSHQQALEELQALLGQDDLITDAAGKRPYETDGLAAIREVPWVVALPRTRDAVLGVLAICRRHRVPIVPRGAGTGLSGGARPMADGVLLSLARLKRILAIDVHNGIARVEPGVRNLAISEAVLPHGFFYAPDPSSQIACSIGGNVAENAGGVHCLKYGLTVHNVCGLVVATLDGQVHEFGGAGWDPLGLDLRAVTCGSEGLLGIVLEVVVRLTPLPPEKAVVLAAFSSLGDAGRAVAGIIRHGLIPAGLEMMDHLAIRAAEAFVHAGYPLDAEALLLCELDGTVGEVSADLARVEAVMREEGAFKLEVARDPQAQARLWLGRKAAFPAVGRLAPDYYCMDGTIPRGRLAEVLDEIARMSDEFGLKVANVFHAGDGNLHPLILYDANNPGELEKAERFGGRILSHCVAVGGAVSGEHGVGVEKLDQMCDQFSAAELAQFERLKAAFDPDGLLNPGKALPTLTRCVDVGGMHVHANSSARFTRLDRF